jgi:two-component system, chemotaxis family, sensor kinase CheA
MQDPLKYFRIEAREILEQLQSGALALERSGVDRQGIQGLLRLAHTLKGAARVVKQLDIANLAHQFEDLLVPLRDAEQQPGRELVESLLGTVDAIAGKINALAPAPAATPAVAPPDPARAPAPPVAPSPALSPEESRGIFAAPLEDVENLMDGVAELGFQLGSLRRALPSLEESRRAAEQVVERLHPRRLAELTPQNIGVLRAQLGELTRTLEQVGRDASVAVERAARELGQVRDRVDQLRLVPAASIFGTLERTTRDAAVSLGKHATFEARGGDVRLDAEVLTAVQRALVQAVRNAVAHGIEPPAERSQFGKPERGRVTLEIQRRGKQICFSCRDDGRGVNLDEVRRQAERLGRLPAKAGETELFDQLLRGGISTSAQVSEVSGRGVGMDLIREALVSVGGTVSLSSETGGGTRLTLNVPASLAALDGLVVEAGGAGYALPLDAVVRAARLPKTELSHTADGTSLLFEDSVVRFVPLAWLMRNHGADREERAVWSIVLLRSGDERLALGVDRLLGSESLVARALPDSAEVDATVAGVSLDADGNPRLLLDPEGLIVAAKQQPTPPRQGRRERRGILVIDDSLTTRMLEQSILESAGYEVELASSAEEGLEKALARHYDLFLVDVEMPGMDGFSFVEQVRADPRLSGTPAVLVTSRASAEDLARGKAAGASGHIAKGEFDQVDFLERIGRLMR